MVLEDGGVESPEGFVLKTMVVVCHPELKKAVSLGDVQNVSGKMFFRLVKAIDAGCMRLLLCKSGGDRTGMRKTNIVEQLTNIKDAKFRDAYAAFNADDNIEVEDLGVHQAKENVRSRTRPRYSKATLEMLPKVLDIDAPSIDDVVSCVMTVLATKPGKGLWVELSPANLEYLTSAVTRQIHTGTIRRVHPSKNVPRESRVRANVKGTSYSYARSRVVQRSRHDGKLKRRFFRAMSAEDGDDGCEVADEFDESAQYNQSDASGADDDSETQMHDASYGA